MSGTRVTRRIHASPRVVYHALIDAAAVATWMVPDGMTSEIHAFDPREGGSFRISLTYRGAGAGKTTERADTYHGRFVRLVPDREVVQAVEFESADPALQGEMTITITLFGSDGDTDLAAEHDRLPPGLAPADNELGWQLPLAKLAALVEAGRE